jgi:hypothetical protein
MLEMGRTTTAYMSGYNRSRIHQACLYAGEVRSLGLQANGAMPVGETVASVVWDTWNTDVAVLGAGAIEASQRAVNVDMKAQCCGRASVRCIVTTSGGGRYVQWYSIRVLEAPVMQGDTWVQGSSHVVVTA